QGDGWAFLGDTRRTASAPGPGRQRGQHVFRFPVVALRTSSLLLVAAVALLAACAGEVEGDSTETSSGVTVTTPTADPTDTATTTTVATEPPTPTETPEAPLYDPTLVRDDVDCSLEFIS